MTAIYAVRLLLSKFIIHKTIGLIVVFPQTLHILSNSVYTGCDIFDNRQ